MSGRTPAKVKVPFTDVTALTFFLWAFFHCVPLLDFRASMFAVILHADSPPARMTRRYLASVPLGDLYDGPTTVGTLCHVGFFFLFTELANPAEFPFDTTTQNGRCPPIGDALL